MRACVWCMCVGACVWTWGQPCDDAPQAIRTESCVIFGDPALENVLFSRPLYYRSRARVLLIAQESCPADREIITHYQDKLPYAARKLNRKAQLMAEDRTFSIPPEIST